MTQPEDDAARLARECVNECKRAMDAGDGEFCVGLAGAEVMIAEKLRAHLSERDARERMVREAAERLVAMMDEDVTLPDVMAQIDVIRAALSAKSDEQTPTTTGGTNGM